VFRFRREGDEIEKFGGGTQSLKKFFNEKKIPPKEREHLPLIAEKESGEIYAVCGVEISEKVKITQETKRVLYIYLQKKGDNKDGGNSF
jgi:tRNA(Ile)-lysidine synthetase-like protein